MTVERWLCVFRMVVFVTGAIPLAAIVLPEKVCPLR